MAPQFCTIHIHCLSNCRSLEQERLTQGLLGCPSLKELLTSLAPDALAHLLQALPEVTVMNVSWQS